MSEPFNKLTPAQAERLAMLSEECGEVIMAIGKILRHGYDSIHPDQQGTPPEFRYTNRKALSYEVKDVIAVASALAHEGEIDLKDADGPYSEKAFRIWQKKLRYTHHQGVVA